VAAGWAKYLVHTKPVQASEAKVNPSLYQAVVRRA
jgi:hypothetical protein